MWKQRRLFQLGFGAGLVTMVLGALLALAPVAGADHNQGHGQDPHGNNGTVKIDGVHPVDGPGHSTGPNRDEQHVDNDPHVLCQFEVEFFGFDEGQRADILITAHPPTGNGEVLADDRGVLISSDPAGGAANDPDVVIPYDLSEELAGFEPHDVHGWHVKLALTLYDADGREVPGGKKHKVFWVHDCVPEPEPELGISLAKANDADDDGVFTDAEEAPAAGSDVTFRIEIANTGDAPLTIESLEDVWPGQDEALDLLAADLDCTRGEGDDAESVDLAADPVLPAGTITTCYFTLQGYAPGAGGSLTNTVTVITDEGPRDEDTSTVTSPGTTPPPPPPPTPPAAVDYEVVVDKLNDADGDGIFGQSETAASPGAAVTFQITIENTGDGSLVLQTLTDTVPGRGTIDLLGDDVDLACSSGVTDLRVGSVLPVGSVTVCTFVLEDYAPAAGDSLTNTVTVVTDQDSDTDTSTVVTEELAVVVLPTPPVENVPPAPPALTPPAQVPPALTPPQAMPELVAQAPAPEVRGDVVTRTLPRTGDESRGLAGMGAFLIALGAAMVLGSRRQLAAPLRTPRT